MEIKTNLSFWIKGQELLTDTLVLVGSRDWATAAVKKKLPKGACEALQAENTFGKPGRQACSSTFTLNDSPSLELLWFDIDETRSPADCAMLVSHESVHAVDNMLEQRGLPNDSELRAYLVDYLVFKIISQVIPN